jgi:hypothetical protein
LLNYILGYNSKMNLDSTLIGIVWDSIYHLFYVCIRLYISMIGHCIVKIEDK